MTNKEDVEDSVCNPRKAALVAVHLVSQVLNEAYVIANAAKDSGEPWLYLSNLKKLRSDNLDEFQNKDLTYTVLKEDNQYMYGNNENVLVTDEVATSTPQKIENNMAKCMNKTSYIGQGDEEFEVKNELRRTTSMFINHLFDMSDVEHVNLCDETQNMQDDIYSEIWETNKDIKNIIDSYITSAVHSAFGGKQNELDGNTTSSIQSTENSSYSFLDDAFSTEIQKELCTENFQHNENIALESVSTLLNNVECSSSEKNSNSKTFRENTILTCEDAYLTLNRDYEQYSEDEEPILQDAKTSSLQEIELITVDTPTKNVTPHQEKEKLVAISRVTTSGTSSRKSNLVRRCRVQSARLLSCLRGWWWRRKRLSKRKEGRVSGSIRGLSPLSPDARRRASSLLDQRTLRTPSPSKSCHHVNHVWKFNTLNEALVHSSQWKDFGYKMSLNENYEF